MFRASLCPSSGAYQLQQQPLVYRRNVVIEVLLVVVGPAGIYLVVSFELVKMNGTTNTKFNLLAPEFYI